MSLTFKFCTDFLYGYVANGISTSPRKPTCTSITGPECLCIPVNFVCPSARMHLGKQAIM